MEGRSGLITNKAPSWIVRKKGSSFYFKLEDGVTYMREKGGQWIAQTEDYMSTLNGFNPTEIIIDGENDE